MAAELKTYTGTATLKTCRNGTSWRANFPNAGQGRYYSTDTAQRVGYIGFGFNLLNKEITEIKLTFKYDNSGYGSTSEKTLGMYKWEGYLSPTKYTASNLLGTITSANQYNCTTTFTFNSKTNESLFANLKSYFESGNNVIMICRPSDSGGSEYSRNYLLINEASVYISYYDTYNMNVDYKVNGTQTGYESGYETAGTFKAKVGGRIVADNAHDLNYRAKADISYCIEPTAKAGWMCTTGEVKGNYPTRDFNIVLDFRQTYTISYNNGGGGIAPDNQTKINGEAIKLRGAMTRPVDTTSAGSYTVTLNLQQGSFKSDTQSDYLVANRTISYTFLNWTSGNRTYSAGYNYQVDSNLELTANWASSISTSSVTLPEVERAGYKFKGWGTSSTAEEGITGSYTPTRNITLYAIWEPQGLARISNGTRLNSHTVWINENSTWKQHMPYIYSDGKWKLYSG